MFLYVVKIKKDEGNYQIFVIGKKASTHMIETFIFNVCQFLKNRIFHILLFMCFTCGLYSLSS